MPPKRTQYRFSFGPWNIDEGADPFGPPVRKSAELGRKIKILKKLGFDGMQFHDDDAVPDLDTKSPAQITRAARKLRSVLDGEGIVRYAEVVSEVAEEPNYDAVIAAVKSSSDRKSA